MSLSIIKTCDKDEHNRFKVTWVDPQQGVILPCALCKSIEYVVSLEKLLKERKEENEKLSFYLSKEYKIPLFMTRLFEKF